VVGYKTYIDLLFPLLENKQVFSTGMTQEVARCNKAIEFALEGKKVAIVSSGDAGIYGMAGLVLELSSSAGRIHILTVPGVPAFCAAAAILGAPLMHDFASISLSDLLTPWEVISKRVNAAAMADYVIILYNPRSKKRTDQLLTTMDIISQYRKGSTPIGIVKNASRADQEVTITTLGKISDHYDIVNMTTIIIVGNSSTYSNNGKMVTPRGYKLFNNSGV